MTEKLLLLLIVLVVTSQIQTITAKDFTPDDFRDAMVTLVRMFRTSDDKLERHESREKALGEQLKKALANLDKKHKSLEPLKGAISRLDERLSNVETILIQKDEREKQQMDKNNEVIESMKKMMGVWSTNMANMVKAEINSIKIPSLDVGVIDIKLKNLEEGLNKKINALTKLMEGVKDAVMNLKYEQNNSINNNCKDTSENEKMLAKYTSEMENMLGKFDNKLKNHDDVFSKINLDQTPTKDILAANEIHHNKITSSLDKHQSNLLDLRKEIQNIETALKHISFKNEIEDVKNQTQQTIQDTKYEMMSSNEKGSMKILAVLNDLLTKVDKHMRNSEESLDKSIGRVELETANFNSQLALKFDQLKLEIQALSKGERVMLQTADSVLDTKRRIEYGVHQILLEVGDLVKEQNKGLNSTVSKRFDDIESSIVNSQVGALANLTTKIEYEISQVWRQMGIMHQQVMASNTALDRLQAQTDKYVNGSVSTMDSMEGKVGMITSRMSEVDENLNYLLGRLSLVSQEFNQIKLGLGEALDNIKHSFLIVQNKLKEAGPGPHSIEKS